MGQWCEEGVPGPFPGTCRSGFLMNMVLYHLTTRKRSRAILAGGFRDATGTYMAARLRSGVWFSLEPFGVLAEGGTLLRLVVKLNLRELRRYEWIERQKHEREFLTPASMIKSRCRF